MPSEGHFFSNLLKIGADWDFQTLKSVADQGLLADVPEEKLKSFLLLFKNKLGPIESITDSKGSSNDNFNFSKMKARITARYELKAKFKNGEGSIVFSLIKTDGKWMLLGFNINSPLLIDLPSSNNQ